MKLNTTESQVWLDYQAELKRTLGTTRGAKLEPANQKGRYVLTTFDARGCGYPRTVTRNEMVEMTARLRQRPDHVDEKQAA
ncbi:hypothetical protein [Paraburkholderia sp. A3RO-2L]|uniref:hypothetical protein n=1 Tax=unclassified Paraburkholderia TaxID=2615204 RepID=UPI0032FF6CD4|nr:hypothetical protein [Burkholderia vietnamiensis]